MTSEEMTQWSVLKYDLRTALDVLGLPCNVQVAEDELPTSYRDLCGTGYARDVRRPCVRTIRLEKKICTCYVRARVLDIDDVDWFICKKGREYYKQRSRFVNREILISLDCSSKVRLSDKDGGKLYTSIREVAKDFPRFIRAEVDTVCLSPGSTKCQIVTKGTVLEVDRVTQDAKSVRGFRESFLICIDNHNSRELAFRLLSTCQFSKMIDTTKYNLKDLIERLPLPQTVDFIITNPYDVISASDTDAVDLLVMLGGPLELQCLKMQEYVTGHVQGTEEVVGIPLEEDFLENVLVNIPVSESCSMDFISSSLDYEPLDYEVLFDKMYLVYAKSHSAVALRRNCRAVIQYDMTDEPDPPPLPPLSPGYNFVEGLLSSTEHEENRNRNHGNGRIQRKRFSSASDYERKRSNHRWQQQESRSFKNYLNQFSKKVKTTASQLFFGIDTSSVTHEKTSFVTSLERNCLTRSNPDLSRLSCSSNASTVDEDFSGFICYIQQDAMSPDQLDDKAIGFNVPSNKNDHSSTDPSLGQIRRSVKSGNENVFDNQPCNVENECCDLYDTVFTDVEGQTIKSTDCSDNIVTQGTECYGYSNRKSFPKTTFNCDNAFLTRTQAKCGHGVEVKSSLSDKSGVSALVSDDDVICGITKLKLSEEIEQVQLRTKRTDTSEDATHGLNNSTTFHSDKMAHKQLTRKCVYSPVVYGDEHPDTSSKFKDDEVIYATVNKNTKKAKYTEGCNLCSQVLGDFQNLPQFR